MRVTVITNKVDNYSFESMNLGIVCNIKKDSTVYILDDHAIAMVFASPDQEYALIGDARYYQDKEVFTDKLINTEPTQTDLVDTTVHVLGKGVSTIAQTEFAGEPLNMLFLR